MSGSRAKKPALAAVPAPAPEPKSGPMICGTCLAWKAAPRANEGECRRTAPTTMINGAGVFPRIGAEEWCLQWVKREPA